MKSPVTRWRERIFGLGGEALRAFVRKSTVLAWICSLLRTHDIADP